MFLRCCCDVGLQRCRRGRRIAQADAVVASARHVFYPADKREIVARKCPDRPSSHVNANHWQLICAPCSCSTTTVSCRHCIAPAACGVARHIRVAARCVPTESNCRRRILSAGRVHNRGQVGSGEERKGGEVVQVSACRTCAHPAHRRAGMHA